jgi:hypothetical protein
MATKDMAIVAAVSTSFVAPRLAVIEGTEASAGVMPASALTVKFNQVAVGPDPDGTTSDITGDPKVYSWPNSTKNGTANIVFERYYYGRSGGTPNPPFTSVIQSFDSGLMTSATALAGIINNNNNPYLTAWGGSTAGATTNRVINAYGIVREGGFLYMISYDVWRVTKIDAGTKAVVASIDFDNADYNHAVAPPATVDVRGQGIKVHNGHVYALFNVAGNINGTTVAAANYQPSILVEIDTATFTFQDKNHASPNYVEVGLNSVKIESADDFLYVPGIGGPQLGGSSNITRSGLYRIPVDPNGVLGTVLKAYEGNVSSSAYDIRDIAIGKSYALILIGRWSATYDSFPYMILKITTQALAAVATVTDIATLYGNPAARIDINATGILSYGPFYVLRYEKNYAHFWAGLSNSIKIWDESVIASSVLPTPGALFTDANFYGGSGNINSMDIFIDNAENAYAAPQALRAVAGGVVATGGAGPAAGNIESATMRSLLEEAEAKFNK